MSTLPEGSNQNGRRRKIIALGYSYQTPHSLSRIRAGEAQQPMSRKVPERYCWDWFGSQVSKTIMTKQSDICERWDDLTICLISYNLEKYLPEALEGIVNQTVRPGECIILDDASTDGSWAIISEYARCAPWLTIVRNESNLGVHGNANKGLSLAGRSFFYCASADDFIHPCFVEQARRLHALAPEASVLFGETNRITERGEFITTRRPSRLLPHRFYDPISFKRLFIDAESAWFALSSSTVCNRNDIRLVGGFRAEIGPWADTIAIWACALKGGACYSDQIWTSFRCRPGSYSSKSSNDLVKTLEIAVAANTIMSSLRVVSPHCLPVAEKQPFRLYLTVCLNNVKTVFQGAWRQSVGQTCRAACGLASTWLRPDHLRDCCRIFSWAALGSFLFGTFVTLLHRLRR